MTVGLATRPDPNGLWEAVTCFPISGSNMYFAMSENKEEVVSACWNGEYKVVGGGLEGDTGTVDCLMANVTVPL